MPLATGKLWLRTYGRLPWWRQPAVKTNGNGHTRTYFNPSHEPAGTPEGGQFAPSDGGMGVSIEESEGVNNSRWVRISAADSTGKKFGELEMQFKPTSNSYQVREANVQEGYRGKGYGKALYKAAIVHAQKQNAGFHSDLVVSIQGDHVWEALKKDGIPVEKNPGAVLDPVNNKWHVEERKILGGVEYGIRVDRPVWSLKGKAARTEVLQAKTFSAGPHAFATTQLDLPPDLQAKCRAWVAAAVAQEDRSPDEAQDDAFHLTVLYGLKTDQHETIRLFTEGSGPVRIALGTVAQFDSHPDYDVLILPVTRASGLLELRARLTDMLPWEATQAGYVPHVTLAYVKKGAGRRHVGDASFLGDEAVLDRLRFTSSLGEVSWVSLLPSRVFAKDDLVEGPGGKMGVWRTVRGRKVFIEEGESLKEALAKDRPSGKWKEEAGKVTAFHGTVASVLPKIKKEGLRVVRGAKRTFPGQDAGLYADERGRSVFVANKWQAAMWYARQHPRGIPVILELRIPKGEFEGFHRDLEHNPESRVGTQAAATTKTIKPQWIVAAYKYDPFEGKIPLKFASDVAGVGRVFVVIVVGSSEHAPMEVKKGNGNGRAYAAPIEPLKEGETLTFNPETGERGVWRSIGRPLENWEAKKLAEWKQDNPDWTGERVKSHAALHWTRDEVAVVIRSILDDHPDWTADHVRQEMRRRRGVLQSESRQRMPVDSRNGKDQMAYAQTVGNRQPTIFERKVDFVAIDSAMKALTLQGRDRVRRLLTDAKNRLLSLVAGRHKAGRLTTKFVLELELRGLGQLVPTLRETLGAAFRLGQREARKELKAGRETRASLAVQVKALALARPEWGKERLKASFSNGHAKGYQVKLVPEGLPPEKALEFFERSATLWGTNIKQPLLSDVKGVLMQGIKTGQGLRDMMVALEAAFLPWLGDEDQAVDDQTLSPYRLENMIRTNVSEAMNEGRKAQFQDGVDSGFMIGFQFSAILDERTTPVCTFLDGLILQPDSPELDQLTPPRHWGCRSLLSSVLRTEGPVEYITPQEVAKGLALSGTGFAERQAARTYFNPAHKPAGTPEGGQFAPAEGALGLVAEEGTSSPAPRTAALALPDVVVSPTPVHVTVEGPQVHVPAPLVSVARPSVHVLQQAPPSLSIEFDVDRWADRLEAALAKRPILVNVSPNITVNVPPQEPAKVEVTVQPAPVALPSAVEPAVRPVTVTVPEPRLLRTRKTIERDPITREITGVVEEEYAK